MQPHGLKRILRLPCRGFKHPSVFIEWETGVWTEIENEKKFGISFENK